MPRRHMRSDAELQDRASVNVMVRGVALVKLRAYRDRLNRSLGIPISLSTALEFALNEAPQPEGLTIAVTRREVPDVRTGG
jgi:hypothetical protein